MAKVLITFSVNNDEIGKTRTVPDDEAQVLVREGRARYTADQPPRDTGAEAPFVAETPKRSDQKSDQK